MRKIELNNKTPLYIQIKENLKEEILSGRLKSGQAIPTELLLAEMYSVSRATVRQAITDLVRDGFLVRHQGKGTFVNKPKIETNLSQVYSFAQDMTERGLKTESKIIDFETVLPKASIKEKLKISDGDLVYRIVRLRLVEEEPILLETTFLPCNLFPDFEEEKLQKSKSLYTLLEEEYKVKLNQVTDYFEPVLIDDFLSKLLEVPQGSPALYLERIGFINNDIRAELSQSTIRGDRCRYFVHLFR